jgi:hypothetical protein
MHLHDTFANLDLSLLEGWIATRRQEDLHLDFKLLSNGADLSREDRKNLAKAISGFSNSDGGLVVWGVDCRPDEAGVDAAQVLRPISNAAAVLAKLQSLTGEAVSPIVDGVEHRIIATGADASIIVTLVPPSVSGPHMAGMGEGRYYKRSGDSFYRMEHFDVADMFGRRRQPQLNLQLARERQPSSTGKLHLYRLNALISNTGRNTARLFKVVVTLPATVLDWPNDGTSRDRSGSVAFPFTSALSPLFAGDVCTPSFSGLKYHMTSELYWRFSQEGWPDVAIEIFCDGLAAVRKTQSFESIQEF